MVAAAAAEDTARQPAYIAHAAVATAIAATAAAAVTAAAATPGSVLSSRQHLLFFSPPHN